MADKLDAFTRAYIQTALWSTNDESDESGGVPLDQSYDVEDIAPETLARIVGDCARFQRVQRDTLANAIQTGNVKCGPDFNEIERAGHDFFLTRNHHGAGFWDGDWPEPYAQTLTNAAHAFGAFDLYVGDDGKLHA